MRSSFPIFFFWRAQISSYTTNQSFLGKTVLSGKNRADGLLLCESSSFHLTMIPAALIKNLSFRYDMMVLLLSPSHRLKTSESPLTVSFLTPFIPLVGKSGFFYLQNPSTHLLLSIPSQLLYQPPNWSSRLQDGPLLINLPKGEKKKSEPEANQA